jgi:hypothetical protein
MFKKRLLGKFTAFVLIVAVFATSTIPAFAQGQGGLDDFTIDPNCWMMSALIQQEEVLRSIEAFWADFDAPEIVLPLAFGVEYECHDLVFGMTQSQFNELPPEIQQEIAGLEMLATLIFDYYQKHGYFPTEEEFMASLSPRARMDITMNDGVNIFRQLGQTVSSFSLASVAAYIGAVVGKFTAIPIMQVVALATGVTLIAAGLVLVIAVAYTNVIRISNAMAGMLSSTWSPAHTRNAILLTQAMVHAKNSGFRIFQAIPFNGPGGGVLIGSPFHTPEAAAQWHSWGQDTFSITATDAFAVVMASRAFGPAHFTTFIHGSEIHTSNLRVLNQPHFHITFWIYGRYWRTHAFFAFT